MCCGGGIISPNKNVKIQRTGDFDFKTVSSLDETDIPVEYQSLFGDVKTLDSNNIYYVIELKNAIPKGLGPITVTQNNIALKMYYNTDTSVTKKGDEYIKTKTYDGSDSDYAVLVTQPVGNVGGLFADYYKVTVDIKDANGKHSATYTIVPVSEKETI